MRVHAVWTTALVASTALCGCAGAFTISSPMTFVARGPTGTPSTRISGRTVTSRRQTSSSRLSMSIKDITGNAEEKMGKSVDSVKQNLQSVRTGRANASILDRVQVEYYGAPTPLNQLATVSVPSSQQLQIDPYDKSVTGDIEKAIIESGIGLTPNNDGDVIRINIPSLTEDRRKELLKMCREIGEEGKVAIRNVRRDGVDKIKKMEKAGDVGKDEMADGLDEMQKITDKYAKEVDDTVGSKEKEVMTV
mmetsp:Transcript_23605/g.51342  ORF Transcript_23605/g.51342 Transcript_23605/m.51342 type:complete len:249 (-) Transcript_23605:169-915(-)